MFEGILVPIALGSLRASETFIFTHGELKNVFIALGVSLLVLFPLCFILGAIFSVGLELVNSFRKGSSPTSDFLSNLPAAGAYFWETLGFAAGGMTFSFFLVGFPSFKVVFLASALCFLASTLISIFGCTQAPIKSLPFDKAGFKGIFALLVFIAFVTSIVFASSPISERLEFVTQKYRYPGLLEVENSPYGQIAAARRDSQIQFFESGLSLGTTEGDPSFNERLTHLIFSIRPNPEKVLLIGGGWSGVLDELLKYGSIEKIDYVELDSELISTIKKYLSPERKTVLEDPKINLHFADGRKFLKETGERYDAVIFNLPNPSTAMVNRFYTQECFEEVKNILADGGVFATYIDAPTDYLSAESQNLLASIYKTLHGVFGGVLVLPQEEVLFLSKRVEPSQGFNPKEGSTHPSLVEPLKNLETSFLTAEEIRWRFANPRNKEVEKLLRENKAAKVNRDFHPVGYFYEAGFWQTMFSFRLAKVFDRLSQFGLPESLVAIGLGALTLVLAVRFRIGVVLEPWQLFGRILSLPVLAVALVGFSLMTLEMILILAFQAQFGYLYSKLALLMGLLLLGMGLGNTSARCRSCSPKGSTLNRVEPSSGLNPGEVLGAVFFAAMFFFAFLPAVLEKLSFQLVYFSLALLGGFLGGMIFPLCSELSEEKRGAVLYGADLLGSALGAILPSLFLIPIWGVGAASFLVSGIMLSLSILLHLASYEV